MSMRVFKYWISSMAVFCMAYFIVGFIPFFSRYNSGFYGVTPNTVLIGFIIFYGVTLPFYWARYPYYPSKSFILIRGLLCGKITHNVRFAGRVF